MKKLFQNDTFMGLVLALIAFLVYLTTLASTIQYEDCGELAADVSTLGIAHPTGYPLLTLLGWMVSHLPIHLRVIWKLNLFVALLCSVAVFFFHKLFLLMLSKKTLMLFHASKASSGTRQPKEVSSETGLSEKLAATTAALILAFSNAYWSQAVSFEVYALHLLFLSLLLLLFIRALLEHSSMPESQGNRTWYLFAFILGLSFTNHMMTILLAPAFLYLYFATHGFGRNSWFKIGRDAIPFLVGLSLYLYLPLRALQKPVMNWGNPVTLETFWRHVSGEQYRFGMFSSLEVVLRQLTRFFVTFPSEFGYVPLLFGLLGIGSLFRRARRLLFFSGLLFCGCLFYSANYNISEIAPYFLLAYVATVIWIVFGIRAFLDYWKGGLRQWTARIFCATLFLWPLCLNYRAVDASRDYAVEDYARNLLGSLEPNAVIFTDQPDYFTTAAYYLQLVEGVRPDVIVLDESLLMNSWYFAQLEQRYPGFIENSRFQVEAFLRELNRLESGREGNLAVSSLHYKEMVLSIFRESYRTRPVYVSSGIPAKLTEEFHRIPSGLVFRLFREVPPAPVQPVEFYFRPIQKRNPHNQQISFWYATAYVNQGVYSAVGMKDVAMAATLMRKALTVEPDFQPALTWLNRLGQGR